MVKHSYNRRTATQLTFEPPPHHTSETVEVNKNHFSRVFVFWRDDKCSYIEQVKKCVLFTWNTF